MFSDLGILLNLLYKSTLPPLSLLNFFFVLHFTFHLFQPLSSPSLMIVLPPFSSDLSLLHCLDLSLRSGMKCYVVQVRYASFSSFLQFIFASLVWPVSLRLMEHPPKTWFFDSVPSLLCICFSECSLSLSIHIP